MFKTPKVPVFMQKASVEGRKNAKMVRFTFYITPIKHALAAEISPVIAELLFTFDAAGAPHPITEMDGPHFNIGKIELQKMYLHPSDDPAMDGHGTLLNRVQISHITARKLFLPDNADFTLEFRAELPMDHLAIEMLEKYYDQKLFLTFETMQMELPTGNEPKCEYCDNPAVAHDSEDTFLCEKDLKNKAVGQVVFIAKTETPAEALARNKAAAGIEDDDRKDTSHINRRRKK